MQAMKCWERQAMDTCQLAMLCFKWLQDCLCKLLEIAVPQTSAGRGDLGDRQL